MKSKYTYLNALLFLLIIGISSCNEKKSATYTFEGKLINGTTNEPYVNVQGDIYQKYGEYPYSNTVNLSSSVFTNENGEFKFNYKVEEDAIGTLSIIFKHPANPFLDLYVKGDMELHKNYNNTIYVSDSGTAVLKFISNKELVDGEVLKMNIGVINPFVFYLTKSDLANSNGIYKYRTSYMFNSVQCNRILNNDTTRNWFDMNIQGDPFIDTIKINY
jgi:hypothetical protein